MTTKKAHRTLKRVCLPSTTAVLKVGDGRGFVIEQQIRLPRRRGARVTERRVVGTAAHCLPHIPPAMRISYEEERTYPRLLGTLDGTVTDIWAECLFVDPIADVAVLGCPDGQTFREQADAYEALVEETPAANQLADARSGEGWVLSVDEPQWIPTILEVTSGVYGVSLTIDATLAGMSGSPILNSAGYAVGIVTCGSQTTDTTTGETRDHWGQAILRRELPAWLVSSVKRT